MALRSNVRYSQAVIILTLGVYLYYLVYRLLYTINPDALTFSLIFFYAELHGFVSLALYFFQLWNPITRKPSPAPPGVSVDVFIPTYNEDIDLVRKTVLGCLQMRYPHKTYILDDGNRPELARMAEELGCVYLFRKERIHAKAGNLNHALAVTDGDFVAILDADYVPQPDFLEKTLGYFADEKVAFVQTPHHYYNVDSFQFRINMKRGDKWNEQDMFYRVMMPGRDYWDSAFFAGTSAVIRTKALKDIGGFATTTITEDVQTTVQLYKRGWKGIYHNEVLSTGLAAKDLKNYHTQKLRWAEGNINMLFTLNPLWTKGLTLAQRICFFATVFGWFIGLSKLIYFTTPAVMLLTGSYPIFPFDWAFIWRYLIFMTVIILGFKIASRGYGRIRFDEAYNMMNFFVLIKAVARSFFRWKSEYIVTEKGRGGPISVITIGPQLTIVLLCFAGITWGFLKLYYGVSADFLAIGIGIFWAGVNGSVAYGVVKNVTHPYHKRADFRFVGAVPVEFSTRDNKETPGRLRVTRDLNENGFSLVTFAPLPIGETLSLALHLGPTVLHCEGTVLYLNKTHSRGEMFHHGVKFDRISRAQMDQIRQFCFNAMLPAFLQRFERKRSFIMQMASWYYDEHQNRRITARRAINLPLIIRTDTSLYVVTNNISAAGLCFASHVPFDTGKQVRIEIPTPFGTIDAEGEIRNCREIASRHLYFLGVQFLAVSDQSRDIVSQLAEHYGQRAIA